MASELIDIACLFAIKIALLSLYYRLFQSHCRKFIISVYIAAGLIVIGSAVAIFFYVFQCTPFSYAFDKSTGGSCLDIASISVVVAIINAAVNSVLLLLPLPIVWHLRVSKSEKLAISGMFLLGGS